jgi:hypothetical protein
MQFEEDQSRNQKHLGPNREPTHQVTRVARKGKFGNPVFHRLYQMDTFQQDLQSHGAVQRDPI